MKSLNQSNFIDTSFKVLSITHNIDRSVQEITAVGLHLKDILEKHGYITKCVINAPRRAIM